MNTNTHLKYLAHAIQKVALDPLHPNFIAALKAKRKNSERLTNREITLHEIRHALGTAAKKFDDPKLAVAKTVAYFAQTKNTTAAVVMVKELMKDCAFQANIDISRLNRQIDATAIEEGVDAMFEDHPVDLTDVPLFDQSDFNRATEREEYAGPEQDITATSIEDAVDAIEYLQIWLISGFSRMSVESQQFWGFENGLCPLDQRAEDNGTFTPIYDLDDYRQLQKERGIAQRNNIGKAEDIERFMMAA